MSQPTMPSPTGLRIRVFLVKHSSREHKQNKDTGPSNAALAPGHGFTLGISWHAQTSQAQQGHPHTKTATRKRLMLQEPLSPLAMWWHCSVYVSPSSPPAPKPPSLVSIQEFRSASRGNVAAAVRVVPSPNPPQKTNAPFGCISHRDLCWIKAVTRLLASQRSRTPLTPQAWPLPVCISGTHPFLPAHQPLITPVGWNRLYRG